MAGRTNQGRFQPNAAGGLVRALGILALVILPLCACQGRSDLPVEEEPDVEPPEGDGDGDGDAEGDGDGEGDRDAGSGDGDTVPDAGAPLPCAEEALDALFDERIGPILADDHVDSCNACHLDGLKLDLFARETACESMQCLIELGWVDLASPDESLIFDFIDRARDAGVEPNEGISAASVSMEHEAFSEWVALSARCHEEVCAADDLECSFPDAGPPATLVDAGEYDADGGPFRFGCAPPSVVDDPTCSYPAMSARFETDVWFWKGRCSHCHDESSSIAAGAAPRWMTDPSVEGAAEQTLCTWRANGYMDLEDPMLSKILRKPLPLSAGGIAHGGGAKFLSLGDPGYLGFLSFIEAQSLCYLDLTVDAGTMSDGGEWVDDLDGGESDGGLHPPPLDAGPPDAD